jgi:hypothetical protein
LEVACSGNVLLRGAQDRAADDAARQALMVRAIVAAKAANQRAVLRRAPRDHVETMALEARAFRKRPKPGWPPGAARSLGGRAAWSGRRGGAQLFSCLRSFLSHISDNVVASGV